LKASLETGCQSHRGWGVIPDRHEIDNSYRTGPGEKISFEDQCVFEVLPVDPHDGIARRQQPVTILFSANQRREACV
jgi:hypothetical protein